MLRLIQFEIKKLFRSTYSIFMIIILLLSISGFFVYSYINTMSIADYAEGVESMEFTAQQSVNKLEEQIEEDPSLADKHSVKSELESHKKWLTKHKKEKEALLNEDWNYLLNEEIEDNKDYVEEISAEYYPYRNMSRWPSDFTYQVHYHRTIWLQDNNIRPVMRYDYLGEKTIYDITYDDPIIGEIIPKTSNKYSSTSFYFIYKFFGLVFGMIGIGFFLFLFGDIFTKEGLDRYGPIHFLYTQPISRGKVLISKYITLLINTLLIIIGTVLFSVLLGVIFDRIGAWNYPVLIYQPEESFYFMPMLSFIAIATLLFLMILVFCYSLLFFFSLLTKRTVTAIGFTFGVILLGMMFSGSADTSLAAYNPFHYFQVYDIVTMELAAVQDNFKMSWTNGLLTLGVASGLLWVGTFGITKIR